MQTSHSPYDRTQETSERTLRTTRMESGMGLTPRLLLLDEDSAMVDALSRALQSSVPRLTVDTCFTPDEARRRLVASPCHAIICSPTLTVAGGNSILTCSRRVDPPIPFLLTLRREEYELASQWLDLGVYDFIFSPFEPNQVRKSVEDALLLSKRRALIARKRQALVYLRQRREHYNGTTPEAPLRHRVDELHARQRALDRLKAELAN